MVMAHSSEIRAKERSGVSMEVSCETIRKNLQSKTDGELVELAASSQKMTSEARLLLLQELQIRLAKIKEAPETVQLIYGWYAVVAPIVGIKFPDFCPRCLKSGTGISLRFESLEHRKFRFLYWKSDRVVSAVPHCSDCVSEVKRTRAICSWAAGVLGSLWVATAIWFRIPRFVTFYGFFIGYLPIAFLYDRISAVKLGNYDEEAVEYGFKSHEYAKAFAVMNQVQAENAETLQNELEEAISSIRQ